MKHIRTLIIAGILVAVATGCFGKKRRLTPRHVSLPPGGTVLPTRDCGDLFFVSAMINGLDGFNLILDTGTQGLTLSKEAVEKLWPGKSAGHVDELIVGEYTARDFRGCRFNRNRATKTGQSIVNAMFSVLTAVLWASSATKSTAPSVLP